MSAVATAAAAVAVAMPVVMSAAVVAAEADAKVDRRSCVVTRRIAIVAGRRLIHRTRIVTVATIRRSDDTAREASHQRDDTDQSDHCRFSRCLSENGSATKLSLSDSAAKGGPERKGIAFGLGEGGTARSDAEAETKTGPDGPVRLLRNFPEHYLDMNKRQSIYIKTMSYC